ncbi:hypothetical protein IC575_003105 [Cucumis melo]
MGKATRWLKGLLGIKKDKDPSPNSNSNSNSTTLAADNRKDKKRWSFAKSTRDSVQTLPPPLETAWFRSSYISDSDKEQNKHAIAVAAATAAAADAAVAAAQAAVAVVRLTSQGRGRASLYITGRDRWAAVKIQTVFRGYLARKALRALKGLVKLQAVVRGFLVRKRAAATLHSMQALFRAQTAVRTQRARRSFNKENRFIPDIRPRKSSERFDETRSELFHSKRLSVASSYETCMNSLDESPKIVEIDTYRTRARSRRYISTLSECGADDIAFQTSPIPCSNRPRGVVDCHNNNVLRDFEWCLMGEDCKFPTAHSTPRLSNNSFVSANVPVTPSKSVCGDSFYRPYMNYCPNYMANTQSFKAKLRSQSAPKQRPEPGSKKKLSLNEIMAARNSLSSVRMQRPNNQMLQEEEEEEDDDDDEEEEETSYGF